MGTKVSSTNEHASANPGVFFRAGTDPSLQLDYVDPLSGKVRNAAMASAVDELLVKIRHMGLWETVDFCLKVWEKRYPQEHKQYLKDIKDYRQRRANQYASTKSKTWREILMIPPLVNYLLYKLAEDKIMDYGENKFRREFSKRYAGFRPGEKF